MPPIVGLLAALAVTLVACGFGRLLLGRWVRDDLPLTLRMPLFGWVGLTALAYLILAVGLLGGLRWPVLLALLAVVGGISSPCLRALLAEARPRVRLAGAWGWPALLWAVVGIAALAAAAGALTPPGTNEWDSLSYHLAAPKLFVERGAIFRIVYDHHTNSPFNLEMLYTLGLAFGSESFAKGFHCAVYLLLVCSVAGAAARWASARAGVSAALAAAIVATLPPVAWEAGTAYVDLGTALGEWLALVLLVEWWQRSPGETRWLGLAGVCCGTALATKVLGGMALIFVVGAVLARWALGRPRPAASRGLLALVGLALAVAAPWYVKSYAYTGNPIYPYAYSVFGGADWDEECARTYRADQRTYGLGRVARAAATSSYRPTAFLRSPTDAVPPPGPIARAVNGLFREGMPNPVVGIPLVPLFLTFDGAVFWERPMIIGIVGPLFVAFLPGLLLVRPRRPWAGLLLSFAAFSLCAWWFTTQLTRYLLPMLVALAAPTAIAAERLASGPRGTGRLGAVLATAAILFCLLCTLTVAWPQFGPALGAVSREAAIRQGFEQYDLFEAANKRLTPEDRIALYGEPRGYYLDVPYMWADVGYHTLFRYGAMRGPEDLLDAYRAHGVTAVLINKGYARATYEGTDSAGRLLRQLREQGRLEALAETRQGVLYRLR